ncbi:RTA1 like protein-domain-containing protein [Amylocarpus encephaloides]|uniref:RTA1 like protein-domain-containing protein n=1 Tax=Amylocarpus encephaloides TaxID=45428 RepID=A0A9P8C299_9HELO|nr:RTA1 like protein-domain-containing protein [Amylocarpus encephaloides]
MSSNNSTEEFQLYHYEPNQSLSLACAALFGISTIIHLVIMIRKKTWFYSALLVGAFMMTIGYIVRYMSARSPHNTGIYAIQFLLIMLAPSLYAATMYMLFGRLVIFVNNPSASIIRPQWVTKIFVTGDVISFVVQMAGGGMMSSDNLASIGQTIMMIGLASQLAFFGFFLVIAITFRARMLKQYPGAIPSARGKESWYGLLALLLLGAGLVIFRCIFRLFEFGLGRDGELQTREVYVYVFDTLPMFFVQVLFHFKHAGNVFGTQLVEDSVMMGAVDPSDSENQKGHRNQDSLSPLM